MQAAYDGRQIVGIDLHRRRSVIVRMSETGERLDQSRIDNDPMALATEIAKAGEHPQVVLEPTYGWYWAGRRADRRRRRRPPGLPALRERLRIP
jgi:hypothetical protein